MTTFSDTPGHVSVAGNRRVFQDLLQNNDVSRMGQFTLTVLRAPASDVRLSLGSIRAG
jgi:hypothetical protein